jgi:hypothetical protein
LGSRYVAVRLSNGEGVVVAIQNAVVRPYALELITGLIAILNGEDVTGERLQVRNEVELSEPAGGATPAAVPVLPRGQAESMDQTVRVFNKAWHAFEADFDDSDKEFLNLFRGGFRDVHQVVANDASIRLLWPARSGDLGHELEMSNFLIGCLYMRAMTKLPANVRRGMGDELWFQILRLQLGFHESLEVTCAEHRIPFNFEDELAMVLQMLLTGATSGQDNMTAKLSQGGRKRRRRSHRHLF